MIAPSRHEEETEDEDFSNPRPWCHRVRKNNWAHAGGRGGGRGSHEGTENTKKEIGN
jgi:hypothetical protein